MNPLTPDHPIFIDQDSPDLPVSMVDGVRILEQNFDIPEGALPVRMQVGDAPVTIIGWVRPDEGTVSALLRSVADELDKIEAQDADPGS